MFETYEEPYNPILLYAYYAEQKIQSFPSFTFMLFWKKISNPY